MTTENPLADEVRRRVADGDMLIFVTLDRHETLFLAGKFGPAYLEQMTDADLRRVVVY